jgi:hypothetical protein
MSSPRPDDSFLLAAQAHVLTALDAIGEILQDKSAPAATRLRAAFGIIELVYGRPRAARPEGAAEMSALLAAHPPSGSTAGPARKESIDERFARMRREKAARASPAPA